MGLAAGCGDNMRPDLDPDARVEDPDARVDANMPDASQPDANMPDASQPDANIPDASVDAPVANTAPAISAIADQATGEDIALVDIPFTISDAETDPGALVVTAVSSDTSVIAQAGVVLGGAGAARTITLQPVADVSGATTITITVDDGEATAQVSFVVTVTPVNDAPIGIADSFIGGAGTTGNVRLVVTGSVLANDTDIDGPNLAVTAFTGVQNSAQNGDVTMNADGTFSYTPAPGFLGIDTFTYEVSDNHPTDPRSTMATVTIEVSGPMTWFVNNTAASVGDGRDIAPFAQLNLVESAPVTGTGDTIVVAYGDGTSSNQDQGIVLKDNQKLLGALLPAPPVVTNSSGDAVTLASGNTVTNLIIQAPSGAGIAATGVNGTATISAITINDAAGGGVSLQNSASAVFDLDGVGITTLGSTGFLASNAGQVTVANSAVASTNGPAVQIADTALQVSLQRVSASGAISGVVLSNTSGSFAVTGDGSNAQNASGGIIESMSGPGISLNAVSNISLGSMTIQNTAGHGIIGNSVTGLVMRGNVLSDNGDAANEHGIEINDLLGTGVIDTTRVVRSAVDAVRIVNSTGTLTTLAITGSQFEQNSLTLGNVGINLESRGSARMESVTITGSTFSMLQATGVVANAVDTSFMNVSATGSTFSNNNIAWDMRTAGQGAMVFDFSSNPVVTGQQSHAVNVFTASTSTGGSIRGTIAGNTIGTAGTGGSGSAIGNGVRININGQASAIIAVSGNTIQEVAYGRGIEARARSGTGGLDLTLVNNNVTTHPANGLAGVFVSSTDNNPICANIRGNVAAGGTFYPGPFGGAYIVGEGDTTPGSLLLEGFMTNVATTLLANGNTGTPMSQLGSNIAAATNPCQIP